LMSPLSPLSSSTRTEASGDHGLDSGLSTLTASLA
jgi:hypothetical protein